MDNNLMPLCICGILLSLTVVIVFALVARFKRTIKEKNRWLVRHMKKQISLTKELEQARIEKETMEKLLTGIQKSGEEGKIPAGETSRTKTDENNE